MSGITPEQRKTFLQSKQVSIYSGIGHRKSFDDFYVSERVTLDRMLPSVKSVTDLGCLNGDSLAAIKAKYPVECTGIDIDPTAIGIAQSRFPGIKFLLGDFLDPKFTAPQSDLVIVFNLFDLFEDWKSALINIKRFSKRTINFGSLLSLDRPTVCDRDVSFVFYAQGDTRMLWAVHNVFELAAFCATEHINATSIYVNCYKKYDEGRFGNLRRAENVVLPMPPDQVLCGNIVVEFDDAAAMQRTKVRPDQMVVVNDKVVFDSPWKGHEYR
jgi:ubiquinone/menaquinone biosynthesis C-methylase UbiE